MSSFDDEMMDSMTGGIIDQKDLAGRLLTQAKGQGEPSRGNVSISPSRDVMLSPVRELDAE